MPALLLQKWSKSSKDHVKTSKDHVAAQKRRLEKWENREFCIFWEKRPPSKSVTKDWNDEKHQRGIHKVPWIYEHMKCKVGDQTSSNQNGTGCTSIKQGNNWRIKNEASRWKHSEWRYLNCKVKSNSFSRPQNTKYNIFYYTSHRRAI